jgi:protease-4
MGLADGLGSMDFVAREVIKEPNVVDFTSHEDFADRVAKRLGASMTQSLFKSVSLH